MPKLEMNLSVKCKGVFIVKLRLMFDSIVVSYSKYLIVIKKDLITNDQ